MVIRFKGYRVIIGFKNLKEVEGIVFGGFCISFFINPNLNCKTD